MLVELAIVPVGRYGQFTAHYGTAVETRPSRQPVYDGARALLAAGFSPKDFVRVRYRGAVVLCEKAGELARWTLDWTGDRPRRVPYQPSGARAAA